MNEFPFSQYFHSVLQHQNSRLQEPKPTFNIHVIQVIKRWHFT